MNFFGGFFIVVFTLFWSTFTLAFDGMITRTIWQRLEARGYPTVTGKVISSMVRTSRGSKGSTTYRPDIHYTYRLGDRVFSNTRFQFGDINTSGSKWAHQVVSQFPPGREVTVYYSPADPGKAVLFTGLDGGELFMILFLTPFNCIMLAFWSVPVFWIRRRRSAPVAGGVKITRVGPILRARVSELGPLAAALLAAGATAFALIFVVGFTSSFQPQIGVSIGALGVVWGAAAFSWFWRQRRLNSGIEDVWIDNDARTLRLPRTRERKEPVAVSFDDVASISVDRLTKSGSKGGTYHTYAPTLRRRDGSQDKLADWSDQKKADAFTAWLKQQLDENAAPHDAPAESNN